MGQLSWFCYQLVLLIVMNASIDIGNTHIKLGLFDKKKFVSAQQVDMESIVEKCREYGVVNAIVCSVGKNTDNILALLKLACSGTVIQFGINTKMPVKISYDSPNTLGMDRVAAGIGAYNMVSNKYNLVIDVGSCITYDIISPDGVFLGGVISPGIEMKLKAMSNLTAGLPLTKPDIDAELIGKNTKACMKSGVWNGTLAEIEGFIRMFSKQFATLQVQICGGYAEAVERSIKGDVLLEPNLVLIGLNTVLLENVNA